MTCLGSTEECHAEAITNNPNLVSMLHEKDNHILIMKEDYDNEGHIKKAGWTAAEENKLNPTMKTKMQLIYEREFV